VDDLPRPRPLEEDLPKPKPVEDPETTKGSPARDEWDFLKPSNDPVTPPVGKEYKHNRPSSVYRPDIAPSSVRR
jgi:hypothetical protein